jgi:hypothetical protein
MRAKYSAPLTGPELIRLDEQDKIVIKKDGCPLPIAAIKNENARCAAGVLQR